MLIKAYCYRAQLSSYANYGRIMRKIHHEIEWGKHMENALSRLIHARYKNARMLSAFMALAGSRCISRAICHTLSYTYGTSKKQARV